jgi:hypothetical protein
VRRALWPGAIRGVNDEILTIGMGRNRSLCIVFRMSGAIGVLEPGRKLRSWKIPMPISVLLAL